MRKKLPLLAALSETDFLKVQMQAIQTEMQRFRTEIGKMKTLERKVDELEGLVAQIQTSLLNLNITGQSATNSKLDNLIGRRRSHGGR